MSGGKVMETKDRQHLQWIYARMVEIHKEDTNCDYMIKFRGILKALRKADGMSSVCCDAELVKLTTYGYDECVECGKTYRQKTEA